MKQNKDEDKFRNTETYMNVKNKERELEIKKEKIWVKFNF